MRKILTIIPAGEVYNHDCVRWYRAADVQRSINHYHNIGDAFVHDSSLKLLDYDVVEDVNIREIKDKDVDRYNSEYEYCFLRGSNYINEGMNWYGLPELLRRLKIPVIAFGIGAQAPSLRPLQLSASTQAVLQAIAEHCTTIGVRGAYTADVLAGLGIKNVRIIGCPTLFRNRDPELSVAAPRLDALRNLGFTLRREVSATYTSDVKRYLAVHRETILALAARFDLRLLAQGEVEEKKIVLGTEQQRVDALQALTAAGWLDGPDDPLTRLYAEKLFYADVVADIEAMARTFDLVLGYRLHGNLMALANGIPSVYFTYDSRTAEFAETFAIPAFDVYAGRPFVLEEHLDPAGFAAFNRAYRRGYAEMRTFLGENGVAHRLDQKRAVVAELAATAGQTAGGPVIVAGAARACHTVSADAIEGAIDRIEGQRISGWAWCRTAPDARLAIAIKAGGRELMTVSADRLRKDLLDAGIGDGCHAFEATIPLPLTAEERAQLAADALAPSSGARVALPQRLPAAPAHAPVAPLTLAPVPGVARLAGTDGDAQVLAALQAVQASLRQTLAVLAASHPGAGPAPRIEDFGAPHDVRAPEPAAANASASLAATVAATLSVAAYALSLAVPAR